jgi:hypothetical protein
MYHYYAWQGKSSSITSGRAYETATFGEERVIAANRSRNVLELQFPIHILCLLVGVPLIISEQASAIQRSCQFVVRLLMNPAQLYITQGCQSSRSHSISTMDLGANSVRETRFCTSEEGGRASVSAIKCDFFNMPTEAATPSIDM